MPKNKVCAIINFRNHIPFGRALESFGWADVYYSDHVNRPTGDRAPNSDIDKLHIDFSRYQALLLQHEVTPDRYAVDLARKQNPKIIAIGNQHGFYKSITQVINHPPPNYDYWNTWGKYWLDRSKQIYWFTSPKWINLGSYLHEYYQNKFQWQSKKTNGKALVIYEPNTDESWGDPKPDKKDDVMHLIFDQLEKANLDYNIKAHPLWPKLKGKNNAKMWQPPKPVVDFDIEAINQYSLVIGSRSTVLFDALAMGMPVIGVKSTSQWRDDHYGPENSKVFPYAENKFQLQQFLKKFFNKPINYKQSEVNYYLGPLGQIADKYKDFCLNAPPNSHRHRPVWQQKCIDFKVYLNNRL